jgi:hypothetical protein
MLDHISNLQTVFAEYYSFYDISKNPGASNPLVYEADLGYKVYDSQASGKVDLQAGFRNMMDEIKSTGVSGQGTFWNISTLTNQLRDAHIQLYLSSLYPALDMAIVPFRVLNYNGQAQVTPIFSLDANAKLQLQLHFTYNKSPDESATVSTVNGMSVHDFMVGLANNPALPLNFQSLGARINYMLLNMSPFSYPNGFLVATGRPSSVLPDSFQVKYMDGTSETFYTSIAISDKNSMFTLDSSTMEYSVNRTLYELYASLPGDIRYNFDVALNKIGSLHRLLQDVPQEYDTTDQDFTTRNLAGTGYTFDNLIPSETNASSYVAAYKIEADYAILKLESFEISENYTAQIYQQVAQAAKDAGVTKLMIDVSNNLGGIALSGLTLAHLLYPSLDISTWFHQRWNIRNNAQMQSFKGNVLPLLQDILSASDSFLSNLVQVSITNTSASAIHAASVIVNNMKNLCPSNGFACEALLPELKTKMSRYAAMQTPERLIALLQTLIYVLLYINPWTVGLPFLNSTVILDFMTNTSIYNIDYGGKISSFTEHFDLDPLGSIADLVAKTTAELNGFTFDEFLIVSNGVAASTTAIFVSASEQIWKNRNKSGVTQPLITLAYGGSGKANDIALAAVPASIRDVNLDFPVVAFAAMIVWEAIVSGNSGYVAKVNAAVSNYSNVLISPPYFSMAVPTLPVVTYYDTFMGPDALPMQFIYMPPDEYLPNMYMGVSLEDATDLAALYEAASPYFPTNNGGGSSGAGVSAARSLVGTSCCWSLLGLGFISIWLSL